MKSKKRSITGAVWVILLNIVLVITLAGMFLAYKSDYEDKLFTQNMNDIGNINQASSAISTELFTGVERKLSDMSAYAHRHHATREELLRFIADTNRGSERNIQLISQDGTGYAVQEAEDGGFLPVVYTASSYKTMQTVFQNADAEDTKVCFLPEFTDQVTVQRSFGQYTYVPVTGEDGQTESWTLMVAEQGEAFMKAIDLQGGFDKLSTVLIDADGGYILRSTGFLSSSFYQYLKDYNGFSLDDMNYVREQVLEQQDGYLFFLNGEGEQSIFYFSRIQGTDWFCVTAVPMSSFHMAGLDVTFAGLLMLILLMIMALNFTYLVHMNRKLKKSMKEAQSASEAKTDFLSRMSHDIRTPINVITGMTELAQQEDNPKPTQEYLTDIRSSSRFLLGLVNDILDMNKVESGKMELHPKPYSHEEFATYINAVIRPLCEKKNITFTMAFNREHLTLLVDPLRLNQIFFNLLSNAAKFTPEGGHIDLTGRVEPLVGNKVQLHVAVKDDGCGMSEEFQKDMFGSFTQENRVDNMSAPGSGLGLSIVKSLVDLMGGSIRVESKVGVGTTFFITLTLEETQSVADTAQQRDGEATLQGRHVLVCEDHPLNAKILVRMLSGKNIQVDVAENGRLGVTAFENSAAGEYDAVLMDIRMPVMNGLEATEAIRALPRPDAATVPIIALTANAYDTDVQNCLNAGMNAHLAKPIEPALLYATLAEWMTTKKDEKKS